MYLGFVFKNIETSAGKPACTQSLNQSFFIDDGAARSVDQESGWLHERKFRPSDGMSSLWSERNMQAKKIGLPQQGFAIDGFRRELMFDFLRSPMASVVNSPQAKAPGTTRGRLRDSAKAIEP